MNLQMNDYIAFDVGKFAASPDGSTYREADALDSDDSDSAKAVCFGRLTSPIGWHILLSTHVNGQKATL